MSAVFDEIRLQNGSKQKLKIHINDTVIGEEGIILMAGPCSVESEEQIFKIASLLKKSGITALRGGAFKPRTSPYEFQGIGKHGYHYLSSAAKSIGVLSVSEVMSEAHLDHALEYIDIIQVGSRNMHNFSLLKALGRTKAPVLLKRGLSATYKEFLLAAEYILNEGNPYVMLCERGIRGFESTTRNTLDLNLVPLFKQLTHLPIIVDPSHGTGLRELVIPMSCAAIAAGADGLEIEVHYDPDQSKTDAKQAISTDDFLRAISILNNIKMTTQKAISEAYDTSP